MFSFSTDFFLVKTLLVKNTDASLANINTFQFKIKSLCRKGAISHIIYLLLANSFHFYSHTILQPRNLTMYSYVHQKGESILKAEVETEKEIQASITLTMTLGVIKRRSHFTWGKRK